MIVYQHPRIEHQGEYEVKQALWRRLLDALAQGDHRKPQPVLHAQVQSLARALDEYEARQACKAG